MIGRLLPLGLAAALASALALPAAAEPDCGAVWGALAAELPTGISLSGRPSGSQDGFCVLGGVEISFGAQATSLFVADRLMLKGPALEALLGADVAPSALEGRIDGLRVLVRTGYASFDYAALAQSRLARTSASLLMTWDEKARLLRLDRMHVDLPGNNAIYMAGEMTGVDLGSRAAIQTSAASFALTRLDLDARLHGLFEWYLLPALAGALLPADGDAEAAAQALKSEAKAFLAALPEPAFPAATRDAAARIVDELPNPSGRVKLAFRAPDGFGPVRFARYALTGLPRSLAEAGPLFQGITLDLTWTHEDAE
ncbi:hypothetical protein [Xinfangfangia pollutisoli]|uniref:hypothetical protein n=1 Tax=Xinfangfangia pollutisoli TaxID=2865960 RepID=UPI001CD26007|nr:hypothetical protein [Xinfangfangia pollutisoli]